MTRKPCPGCGEVHPDRKPDDVCRRCHADKLELQGWRDVAKARRERGDVAEYRLPWATYTLRTNSYVNAEVVDAWRGPFVDLLKAVGESVPGASYWRPTTEDFNRPDSGGKGPVLAAAPAVVAALAALRAGIDAAVKAAEAAGRNDGRRFVSSLVRGDLSLDQINKVT